MMNLSLRCLRNVINWLLAALPFAVCGQDAVNLNRYYVFLEHSSFARDPLSIRTATPPLVRTRSISQIDVGSLMWIRYRQRGQSVSLAIYDYWRDGVAVDIPCRDWDSPLFIPADVRAGQTLTDVATWYFPWDALCGEYFRDSGPVALQTLVARDSITLSAPTRRKAIDGSQYDASRMTIVRNGVPWASYYWGYRLGLVASTVEYDGTRSDIPPEIAAWPAVPLKEDEFELTALPPPWVEDDVVEYVNRR
ncbi:MAG: hypothetical protein LC098_08885, partial [Burkholderiales bacterium]|nr:hypothetical protein [Burkholderiales bacterium]